MESAVNQEQKGINPECEIITFDNEQNKNLALECKESVRYLEI